VVTVRVAEPLFAVMVTVAALLACQVKVTAWPVAIDVALTERITVGAAVLFLGLFAQALKPHKAKTRIPQEILRKHCSVICSV
jgi:hypothetical protein